MDVNLCITPIIMLQVDQYWEMLEQKLNDSGDSVIKATARYGVTCIVDDNVIQAKLNCTLPHGTVVRIFMDSNIGRSLNWVALNGSNPSDIVLNVKGAEYNTANLEIIVPGEHSLESLGIEILFWIIGI